MASDFCTSVELKRAIERHKAGEVRVIPVILHAVDWDNAPFASLSVLPDYGKPINKWRPIAEAYQNIVKGLRRAMQDLQAQAQHPASPQTTPEPAVVVSEPAPLSPIFRLPYERNPYFTGRADLLTSMHETLQAQGKNTVNRPLVLSGLGGTGKTQLATEYAYRYRAAYPYIFWVHAETHEQLEANMAALAQWLDLPLKDAADQSLSVAAVKRWLQTHSGWLLILDNVQDLERTRTFLPSALQGHIIFTARSTITNNMFLKIEPGPLSRSEAVHLLLLRSNLLTATTTIETFSKQTQQQAHEIASLLGDLPLALDQAGAYIEQMQCHLDGYLQRYRLRKDRLLQDRGSFSPDHPEAVATTWSLSFAEVEHASPAAADLLRLCAFLHPDAIPEALLDRSKAELPPTLQPVAADPFELDDVIKVLFTYSLIRRNPAEKTLSMHRLVQTVLKNTMPTSEQQQWADRVVRIVAQAFPDASDISALSTEERLWCQLLLPHIQICADLLQEWHIETPVALHLLDQAGQYLHARGQYADAEKLLSQLLALQERLDGEDQLSVATTFNLLGELARLQGHYQPAQSRYQRALAIRQQHLGLEHPDVATSLNNLARSYYHFAHYSEAQKLYQQALSIREHTLSSEHPDLAHSFNDLAALYEAQGKYGEALPLYERALHIREQVLGAEHPDTAMSLEHLAALYEAQGKYGEALPLYERALHIREQVLGAEHPDTATSLNNLAGLYEAQGKYKEALPLYERALRIREQVLGAEHPDTATSLGNLAGLYQAQGKYGEALPLYERALHIREQVLGAEHPDTATSLNNLAGLYQAQGKYGEALPLHERALCICEQVLGAEHPTTAMSLGNLAGLYRGQGKYGEALPLYERALRIHEQVLGAEHPTTATSLNNLAFLYQGQGKYGEALPLHERALRVREQVLGAAHPETAMSLNNLAFLYEAQGRMVLAMTYYKRSLAIREKVLGPGHPDLVKSLNNIAYAYTQQNNFKLAEPHFQRALRLSIQTLGPEHPTTITTLTNYAIMLRRAKRNNKAAEIEAQAQAARAARTNHELPDTPDYE